MVYYLDLVTGQVILEGEGEDLHESDDDPEDGLENDVPRRNETTRLYIDPPDHEEEISWMEDFVDGWDGEPSAGVTKLSEALEQENPTEPCREVLRQFPEDRDRWFLYRSGRIRERIDGWIDENGVHSTEPPPWKVGP